MRRTLVLLALCCLAVSAAASSSPFLGKNTLVLLESIEDQQAYSLFFNSLRSRGYTLHFSRADAADLALTKYGEYLYDQLILLAPSVNAFGGGVTTAKIIDFVDSGRSLIVAASPSIGDAVRELGAECGIEFDDSETYVVDHHNFDASDVDGEHTLIVADKFLSAAGIVLGQAKLAPVLFRGIGHAIVSSDPDGLLLEVLSASGTAYSAHPLLPVTELPLTVGTDTRLVTALQARNSARLVFSGSVEMFTNKFLTATASRAGAAAGAGVQSGNAAFLNELTRWAFQERGVLRLSNASHHLAGKSERPTIYRVMDDLEFAVRIEEWNGAAWVAYTATDVQLDFQMLDPYIRKTLASDGKGRFSAAFKVPDVYGVYQFKINYRRKGYSALSFAEQVSVRPFRHNEFERFIVQAYPYYASAFTGMAMFFIFSVVFLHHRSE
eukprot:c2635_g1_i1.p1 GENE.c2635_g1_i1~~c2635_g1_i1.p1  ORF type:complete len:438 (+),score=116.68 c2635_g1_i1:31-1344(+)